MKNEINKKIKVILDLVLEINSIKGYDAFFNYSGHVDSIEVRVQEIHNYEEDEEYSIYLDSRVYLSNDFYVDKDDKLERLNSLQTRLSYFLDKIKNENKENN